MPSDTDLTREAQKIWNALRPMVREEARKAALPAVRAKKMTVMTPPNGKTVGVAEPFGPTLDVPYSTAISHLVVGDSVWVQYFYDNASTMFVVCRGDGQTFGGEYPLTVAQGGTGAGAASDARENLGVPSVAGVGASGTWPISITGNAATVGGKDMPEWLRDYLPLTGGTMTGNLYFNGAKLFYRDSSGDNLFQLISSSRSFVVQEYIAGGNGASGYENYRLPAPDGNNRIYDILTTKYYAIDKSSAGTYMYVRKAGTDGTAVQLVLGSDRIGYETYDGSAWTNVFRLDPSSILTTDSVIPLNKGGTGCEATSLGDLKDYLGVEQRVISFSPGINGHKISVKFGAGTTSTPYSGYDGTSMLLQITNASAPSDDCLMLFDIDGNAKIIGGTKPSALRFNYVWSSPYAIITIQNTSSANYIFKAVGAVSEDVSGTTAITDNINWYQYGAYKAGDTFTMASSAVFAGLITSAATRCFLTVPVDKSLANIRSITVTGLTGGIRTVTGSYLQGIGDSGNWLTATGITVAAYKASDYMVRIAISSSSAFTNGTNNTPVTMLGGVTLSFS